jgi:hypothetical protein
MPVPATPTLTPLQQRYVHATVTTPGITYTQAYLHASPQANRATAAREGYKLATMPKVAQEIARKVTALGTRTEVDQAWVVTRLADIADRAREAGDLGVERLAVVDVAKMHGLWVDRRETTSTVTHRRLEQYTVDQLDGWLEALDAPTLALAPAPGPPPLSDEASGPPGGG